MKVKMSLMATLLMTIAACTETTGIPMSRNTLCGPSEARNAALERLLIVLIRMGGDRFAVMDPAADLETGRYNDDFAGLTADTNYVYIKNLEPDDPQYSNGLSAREVLGPDWKTLVAEEGLPDTCM